MEVNELRIGNYVTTLNRGNEIHLPTGITEMVGGIAFYEVDLYDYKKPLSIQKPRKERVENLYPIKLTEEKLIELGFSKIGNVWFELFSDDLYEECLNYNIKDKFVTLTPLNGNDEVMLCKPLEFVHQMQNLWHSLTGKELILSENNNNNKILIIDIETTNFMHRHGKIVEVGIVELDLMNGKRKILFDEVCQEDGITKEEIQGAWIVSNSDLTLEAIQKSRNFKEMQQEIQNIINSYPLGSTAFNNKFDFDFLEDRGIVITNKLPCPMKLSTDICRIPAKSGFGFKWPKVQEAYDFFFKDNDYVEKHRGADDAYHEAEIVYKLYEMGVFQIN